MKVTLVDERIVLLSSFDREIVDNFCSQLQQLGVNFRLGEKVIECAVDPKEKCVIAKCENGASIRGESLLYTLGRLGNTDGLNLASVGLKTIEDGKLG